MFEEIIDRIKRYDTVIIHRHSRPDGDALGAQIGLRRLIEANFPEKRVCTVGDAAGRYAFMDGAVMDEIPDGLYAGACAIVLDTAARDLVSDQRFASASCSLRIDHHIYCETFTDVEIVDTSFESCCGMIALLAQESGLRMTREAATAIYTGMVTDSGRFRYDSTSPRTMLLASYLLGAGIDISQIYRNLYSEDLSSVKRRAAFLSKITVYEDSPVAYMYNTEEEVKALGMDVFAVSRGMVNVMSDIRGIDIWVNFTEDDGKVLCELRSSKYNINPVAVKFGGGGHKKASGATVANREQALLMLGELKKLTENNDE